MNRRPTRLVLLGLLVGAFGVSAFGPSCTDTTGNGLVPDAGIGGSSSSSSDIGAGGFMVSDSGCDNTCKNDLKKVVDCYGTVLQECLPTQGCSSAKCIDDPCKAAKESKSSYGCDYWAVKTGQSEAALGACFTAFVANTWETPVQITVEYPGKTLPPIEDFAYIPKGQGASLTYEKYDAVKGLDVGEVAILFLARNKDGFVEDCPMPAAIKDEVGVDGTGRGSAFHITTDRPVTAYQLTPYGGGLAPFASATLLLPTSAWGLNYVAVNAGAAAKLPGAPTGQPLIDILAYENDTEVTINPIVDIVGGVGVDAAKQGEPVTYTLNAGEFIEINQPKELTGSPITSTKPVGLWGGSSCLYVPTNKAGCDSAQQQIPPVKALGSEYAAVRYRGRDSVDEVVPWRMVGAVKDTVLTWDPPIPGAPDKIEVGGVYNFESPGPFVVRSQDNEHPFYLSGYMTAGELFSNQGDPEWVNIIPPAQYLDNYVMFADPTYSETSIVVIRTKSKLTGEFSDVMLSCAGEKPLTGWQPVGNYEYTRVDLVTGNFMDVGGCSNGRHELSSKDPFGVTVWGWGTQNTAKLVSYAYPAGAGVQPINDVEVEIIPQ